jgi:NitT/TauT family transport system substrate-binding protein
MRISGLSVALIAIAATFSASTDDTFAQDVLKVSVPQRGNWDTGITELGHRAGIFKKHGLNLEILYTQAGAESQQAVIAGSMDIATAAGVSTVIGAFARGAPVRVISNQIVGSPDLFWYVPANSSIRSIADLAGKTIAYSATGSSTHATLLELLRQYKIEAKPTATGGIPGTLTQTMSGQIDVGWSAAPFGIEQLDQGAIRIIMRGSDAEAIAGRTVRVNLTNLDVLQKRSDALARYMQGYRETVEWMYTDPAALKIYAEFSGLPDSVVRRAREFFPKESLLPDRMLGLDQIIADAVKLKFIPAPLTMEQEQDFVHIPPPLK